MAYYVHQVPGRLRVNIPFLKHQPGRCSHVIETLAGRQGIDKIKVNQVTGSVIVHYDQGDIDENGILNILEYEGLLDRSLVVNKNIDRDRKSSRAGKAVGRAAFSYFVGRALEANGLSLLAAFI